MSNTDKGREKFQPSLEDLIPLIKAADISGLSPDHLRRIVREGELWGIRIGRNWVTTEKAVREYLARDRKPGPKSHRIPGKNK